MTLSLILASFSRELYHLIITQGFLFGAFSGISYIPAVSIISQYFDKRRGLATGLAVSGSGFGAFALSPLTHVLIENLGWRWSLRVIGMVSWGGKKNNQFESPFINGNFSRSRSWLLYENPIHLTIFITT